MKNGNITLNILHTKQNRPKKQNYQVSS